MSELSYIEFSNGKLLSFFFMSLNMVLWTMIIVPQLYKNYQLKSANAVSYFLVLFWFIGSILNLISAYFKNVTIVIIYSAIHSVVIDIIVFGQLLYYRWYRKTYVNFIETAVSLVLFVFIFILSLVLIFSEDKQSVADFIAWVTVIIFGFARVPQIYLNWKRKSVFGLSFFAFVLVTLTSVFFIISIFINLIETSFFELFMQNLQWIISSFITLILDIIILLQFYIYREQHPSYFEINTDV